ncbi:hypothetical protein EB796_024153 [Bugula neritina]|uniref:Uncharacterized protein n=1 Tax=Bugula neritina TaxID=10212 RepID=A0A7J7IWD2_BUGNE|nr:hypothetical protein EB796_024153 [Bugula neritina]
MRGFPGAVGARQGSAPLASQINLSSRPSKMATSNPDHESTHGLAIQVVSNADASHVQKMIDDNDVGELEQYLWSLRGKALLYKTIQHFRATLLL